MRSVSFALPVAALVLFSHWPARAASPDAGWTAVAQIWSRPERFIVAPDHHWLASISNNGHIIQIVGNASGTILRTLVTARAADQWGLAPPDVAVTDDSGILVARFGDITQAWNPGTGEVLAKPPADIVFGPRPATSTDGVADDVAAPGAYKIAATMDREGGETISVMSGSKPIDPVQLHVSEKTMRCGGGLVADATFDGQDLLFSHHQGPGSALPNDDDLPAIAYRLEHGKFRELWRAPCENGFVWSRFSSDGGVPHPG